ncbi:DUF4192 domain-containing protein [uncultured Jatrophihabitans sp.]|uniref:DUF4192 domain-containing protein n=1 Tax=uncultured Jatrophihabitans sp. TaxID=1610747 RepID=UPI0035CB2CA2
MTTSFPVRARRVSGTAELLDAIPYLLGFRPTESLVLLGLRDGCLVVTARLDLADTGQPDLVDDTVAAMVRGGSDAFIVVVADDRCEMPVAAHDDLPWAAAVVAVDECLIGLGAVLHDALLLCRSRWWSYLCGAAQCCPPEGNVQPASPSAFAAAAAFEGVVALPDRATLAATLEPLPDTRRAALAPFLTAAENTAVAALLAGGVAGHERELVRELIRLADASDAAQWSTPDDAAAARLGVALTGVAVRDEVWVAVDSRRLDGRALWAELARRCPSPYDAAPTFLLAWANWRAGNGVLARLAAERVLASDPSYSAADLLLAALANAVDPRTFPVLGSDPPDELRARRRRGRRGAAARTPR